MIVDIDFEPDWGEDTPRRIEILPDEDDLMDELNREGDE